jgi:hypothetical protein
MTNLPIPADGAPTPADAGTYSAAYLTLHARALAGEVLTPAAIRTVLDADSTITAAWGELAAELQHGADPEITAIALRLRMPVDFVTLLLTALLTDTPLAIRKATVH